MAVDLAFGAVILAGGAARRLGGRDKPSVAVGGLPMLDRVLAAASHARPRIVVGPDRDSLPPDVRCVIERPPGGGPVAALAAGLPFIDADLVAVLAADLPGLTAGAVTALCAALRRPATGGAVTDGAVAEGAVADGALFLDGARRRQTMCGVWRTGALRHALASLGDPSGRPLRELLGPLHVVELTWAGDGLPPWFDCDTEDDLRRAEEYPL